ncbi:S8 family serine peptidase [Altererythrobacter luteolus]|uniref:S8 family serine peptidase n=1 Tax=Pontixanthobacter luteolus TaxID=295089 RepID=A0A6I4V963_9SPHN|nr:S8 family serine peptidase [Pontixanthobacter luteolus]MXP48352.1 S8 family serine peptidase [Pontixanthobacter luteolus]
MRVRIAFLAACAAGLFLASGFHAAGQPPNQAKIKAPAEVERPVRRFVEPLVEKPSAQKAPDSVDKTQTTAPLIDADASAGEAVQEARDADGSSPGMITMQNPVLPPKRPAIAAPSPAPKENPLTMRNADLPIYQHHELLLFGPGSERAAERLAEANGFDVISVTRIDLLGLSLAHVRLGGGDTVARALERMAKNKGAAWAQPNYIYQLLGNSREQGLAMHGLNSPGRYLGRDLPPANGVTIAMIDSPVDVAHPDLANANIIQKGALATGAPSPHGTAIAELLVGSGAFPGAAKGAKLVSVPAFISAAHADMQSPAISTTAALVAAFASAADANPDVMNLSFGTQASDDEAIRRMIGRLQAQGVCIAAAAGNGGKQGAVMFPANLESTIAVAAVDAAGAAYQHGSRGREIDVSAWGVDISAAVPGGRRLVSGTSFAAPLVAGAMARMSVCAESRHPAAVRIAMSRDAIDLGEDGPDEIFGAGMLRFGEASLASAQIPVAGQPNGTNEGADQAISVPTLLLALGLAGGLGVLFFFLLRRRRRNN